ncbi:MAG: ATP-binding protein [bacterium]
MTIAKKLIRGFSVVLLLTIILSVVFFYAIARMNSASTTLIENLKLDMFLDESIGDHLRWLNSLADQVLLGRSFTGELDPRKCDFGRWYYVYNPNDPEIVKIHKAIEEPHSNLHYSASKIKKCYDTGAIEEAKNIFTQEAQPAVDELQNKIEELLALSMGKIDAANKKYETTGYISRIVVISVAILAIVISLIISTVISQGISTSIHKLADASNNIAKGNFNTEITITSDDEIGYLAQSYNEMVKDLRRLMQKEKELAAAQAVAELEKKKSLELSQIYNGSPSGIRVVDKDFNIMSHNEAMHKLSGQERKEAEKMKCYHQLKGSFCGTEHCPLKEILNGKELIDIEVERERADGKRFPCRVMASPFKDIRGNTIGVIEVFTDITELREAEERAIRSEKLAVLGKLSATVGHELRNPLSVIANSVYFLKMKLNHMRDEKIKKHLIILEEEVAISNKIINDILTFGRVKEPLLTKVNINNILKSSQARILIPCNILVCMHLQDDLPEIMADEIQLKQVFSNIMLNAVQAMPNGGILTISAIKKDTCIEVNIIDTGEGIPEENLDKIFEPLFSTKSRGTGLGLSVCQNIIEMHKGKITIESKVKRGTKFIIKLPIA